MARGVNKVFLIGNLGQDPETNYLQSGTAVTKIRIATSESWKDKQTGEQKERTEWHDVEIWGKPAEAAAQYLRKGSQVFVEGKIQTDQWQDKETGQNRYRTKVRADNVQFLANFGSDQPQGQGATPQRPPQAPAQQQPQQFDDDIPF